MTARERYKRAAIQGLLANPEVNRVAAFTPEELVAAAGRIADAALGEDAEHERRMLEEEIESMPRAKS